MPALTIQQVMDAALECRRTGRPADARTLWQRVLAHEPHHAEALHQLALLARDNGDTRGAEELFRRALAAQPHAAAYHNNLGNLLLDEARFEEAVAAFARAIELQPDIAIIHNNRGNALRQRGETDEAVAAYRRALALDPNLAQAWSNLGSALLERGELAEALAAFDRAIALAPGWAELHSNRGNAFDTLGRHDDAIAAYRHATELAPHFATAHNNLGSALLKRGHHDEAAAACRRAIELAPGFALAHVNLGNVFEAQGALDEAIACFRRAIELQPALAMAHNNLGNALRERGRIEEAIAAHRRAVECDPAAASIHSNLLAALDYSPGATPASLLAEHDEFDARHCAPLRAHWQPHENPRDTERPLRVGFVSAHFASHPVGRFSIRLLENLDRAAFHVTCFADMRTGDAMTARIRSAVSAWRETAGLSDAALAQLVRDERIDILFDLAGHTVGNRLLAFARKPAPIQVSWLDYAGTTGVRAIDFLLADAREIPPGAESGYREQVLRMPDGYICYDPPADAPPVAPLPALVRGSVTFGSFGAPPKITPALVADWARILARVPGSRLLLKNRGLDAAGARARFRELFAAHDIDPTRVELLGWSPSREVLALYGEVDLALDTFPYNGGLTTCEALWMGVPVVTHCGETFASRHSLAHLTAAGFTDTIARDADEYVELAVTLAIDLPQLAELRAGLRERLAASPLCDGSRFAAHFSELMRDAWRQWCNRSCPA